MTFKRPALLYVLTALLVFLALGALVGGYNLMADPSGGYLATTPRALAGSPFASFFVPGLFLFVVFGVGSVLALVLLWTRISFGSVGAWFERVFHEQFGWLLALAIGLLLPVWIGVQVVTIRMFHPLQPTMAIIGLLIVLCTLEPHVRRYYAASNEI